jgi:hypothetical protein
MFSEIHEQPPIGSLNVRLWAPYPSPSKILFRAFRIKQFVKNTNDCASVRIDQNMQKPIALSVIQSAPQLALKKTRVLQANSDRFVCAPFSGNS